MLFLKILSYLLVEGILLLLFLLHLLMANSTHLEDTTDAGSSTVGDAVDDSNASSEDSVNFTLPSYSRKLYNRTAPLREPYPDLCTHKITYCLRAYITGKICARVGWGAYRTFDSYCWMDFMNCKEGLEIWTHFHMGPCFEPEAPRKYNFPKEYHVYDDNFMDQTYVYPYDI